MYIMCFSKGLSALQMALDDGVLPNKTLGFIPTAGDTYKNPYFVDESRKRLKVHNIKLVELDVTKDSKESLHSKLDSVDGLYIAGGNTFFLLYQLIQKDIYKLLIKKVQMGLPYFGESAGAVLLAKSIEPAKAIDNPEDAPLLESYNGLNLINFFPLPYADRDKYKLPFTKLIKEYKEKIDIIQFTDVQAIITKDGSSYEILASAIETI